MNKKTDYQKPTMTIVILQQHSYILAGSQDPPIDQGDVEDYIIKEEITW